MINSSQKILKELSDLTRNLDVLAKEIRGMNKNTVSARESSVKSKGEKEVVSNKNKNVSQSTDAGKAILDSKKIQDNMFSKFLETFKKNSEASNKDIKKARLSEIKNPGKSLLETNSLMKDVKSSPVRDLNPSTDSIVDLIKRRKEEKNVIVAEGIINKEVLKEKEKVKKEEESIVAKESKENKVKEVEKKEKKSILEKLSTKRKSKEEKMETPKGKTVEEKIEKKSLLSRIREKISDKTNSTKEDSFDVPSGKKTPQKDPILASIVTKIQERKEPTSLKYLTPGIVPGKSAEEKINIKNKKSEQIFQKTTLGSSIKGVSDAIKNKKNGDRYITNSSIQNQPEELSTRSKIEKTGTELKSKFKFKKKESPQEEKPEPSSNKGTSTNNSGVNKSAEIRKEEKKEEKKDGPKKKEAGQNGQTEISSQDIADIKSLLSSINSTLNGPLNIKDNKPYRPHSNMLG